MAGYDFRTKPEAPDELSFYIFANLKCQEMGEGYDVYRFDSMREAAVGFRMLTAAHRDWTVALGGSVAGEREVDFVHRRQGWMNVLLDDAKRIPFWAERADVARAVREFAETVGIDRQVDRELLGAPILVPYEPEGEPGDPYLADKALLPRDPADALSAVAECYVEGQGWVGPDQARRLARDAERSPDERPVITRMSVAYETTGEGAAERGRTGYADIAPHELAGMAERFRELMDVRAREQKGRPAIKERPEAAKDALDETKRQARERAQERNTERPKKARSENTIER